MEGTLVTRIGGSSRKPGMPWRAGRSVGEEHVTGRAARGATGFPAAVRGAGHRSPVLSSAQRVRDPAVEARLLLVHAPGDGLVGQSGGGEGPVFGPLAAVRLVAAALTPVLPREARRDPPEGV